MCLVLSFASRSVAGESIPLSQSLTHANLTTYLDQLFYVYGGEAGLRKVISMVIIEISERKPESKTEQFFVRFRGPRTLVLSKSLYTLEHHVTDDKFQRYMTASAAQELSSARWCLPDHAT